MNIRKEDGGHHVIAVLRRNGKTLREIGGLFGVTRQRVEQITKALGVKKGPRFPIEGFAAAMKSALWGQGYRRCAVCKEWSSEPTKIQRRCRACNRASAYRYRKAVAA